MMDLPQVNMNADILTDEEIEKEIKYYKIYLTISLLMLKVPTHFVKLC